MTVKKLVSNKRFIEFCVIEYGIKIDECIEKSYLFRLMKYWYECPEIYLGPRGIIRKEIEQALKDGQLKS